MSGEANDGASRPAPPAPTLEWRRTFGCWATSCGRYFTEAEHGKDFNGHALFVNTVRGPVCVERGLLFDDARLRAQRHLDWTPGGEDSTSDAKRLPDLTEEERKVLDEIFRHLPVVGHGCKTFPQQERELLALEGLARGRVEGALRNVGTVRRLLAHLRAKAREVAR